MDNSTEYCSFVSVDYIICECGDSFPNEDSLKTHFETDHSIVKQENLKTEAKVEVKYEEENQEEDQGDEHFEHVQEETEVCEQNEVDEKYYLEDGSELILPNDIKQEDYVIQWGSGQQKVIVDTKMVNTSSPSKRVTFKKDMIPDEVVILDQENFEHDYDKESPKGATQTFYFCDTCGKSFSTEKSVKQHMLRVHSERRTVVRAKTRRKKPPKDSVCDVCGKNYASNAALRYHQRVHTGEKPYQCPFCPKAFTMRLFQEIHIRTHTGERPYKCQLCPKAFGNKAALLRHDRVHTGVKPYACPKCGKCFTQSNSMKLHYQTVHLKMPAPYKSAARKLRAQQKGMQSGDSENKPMRILKSIPVETINSDDENADSKLQLIQDLQCEYVVEELECSDNEDYEEIYVSTG